jgi:hypothetical protein
VLYVEERGGGRSCAKIAIANNFVEYLTQPATAERISLH